jgi:hypothetical protein
MGAGVDIATIGIEVDTRQVVEGTRALDALGTSSQGVEQKLGALNGQMNDTSKIMRTQAEASAAASEASQRFLGKLQQEIDLFGLSRAETERYKASLAGLSSTTQQAAGALGSLIDAMHRDERAAKEAAAAQDQATKAGERFVKGLQDQVATLGMNTAQLREYRAAQLGVSDAAAPLISKLNEAGAGAAGAGKHMESLNFQTVGARRELLVLAHELSQGNYQKFGGSMMVLGEQTGAAGLLFSAFGLTVLGVVASLGVMGYAAIKGALDQKHMNDALVMTGNYAGLTADSLNGLAHAAVEAGGSIGEAKKVATELAGSGKFTGDQIGYITEATVAWEHATGQSIKSIIKDFESLAVQSQGSTMRATEMISRATIKLDDQYHFLTESVYEQIRALEKEGDAKGASALATAEFARVTKDRAEEILHNLGRVARGWNGIKESIGGAIDKMGEWGKKETPTTDIAKYSAQLAKFDSTTSFMNKWAGPTKLDDQGAKERLEIVNNLKKAQDALNAANKTAEAQAEKARTQSAGAHAAASIAMEDAKLQKRGMGELQIALAAYNENIAKVKAANPDSPLVTDKAISEHIAAITKAHTAEVKGSDDRAALQQGALAREQANLERQKAIYDSALKLLDKSHTGLGTSDKEYYEGRANKRAEYMAAEAISFAKEASIVQSYKPKNAEEIASNRNKYDELIRQHKKFIESMKATNDEDSLGAEVAKKKQFDDYAKAVTAAGDADLKSLDTAIAKQREHNVEIGKSKEQIELARQAKEVAATQSMEIEANTIQGLLNEQGANTVLAGQYRDIYASRLAYLNREIAKRNELAVLLGAGADLEVGTKAAQDLDKFLDPAKAHAFGDSLRDGFAGAGNAMSKMIQQLEKYGVKAAQIEKQRGNAATAYLNGQKTEEEYLDANKELSRQSAIVQVGSYAAITDAAQSFFDQGSKGYAIVGAASKALHAAELAMNLASIGPKMASAAAEFFAQSGWGGFAGVAAMTAVVAGFGVAVSSGGGSGGGQTAAEVQKVQGTGSVFGDSSAKSDSIARSIALSAANSNIELNYTAGMLSALKSIDASMSGLANLVVGTTGVTDGSNLGIETGKIAGASSAASAVGTIVGGVLLGIGGAWLGNKLASLWGKTTQNIVDSGLQLGGSVADLQSGKGFQQYASVDTTKSSWFGLSKKTSNSVQTGGLDDGLSSQFGLIFTNLEDALKVAAGGLGIGADQVGSALDRLVISTTKVSLKDLKGDDLTAAINGVISKTMDEMAAAAVPGLDRFRKVGEGYAETVVRIATDYANVDGILMGIGKTFGAVGMGSVPARENLIALAGGIDELASQTKGFAENFLSQAEQLAPVSKYVAEQLAAMGLAGVQTRDDFKNVVMGLNLADPAAQKTYASLMALQEAFAKTHAAAEDLTKSEQEIADERADLQKQYDQLTMTSAQLRAKERTGIEASNLALFDSITQLQTAADMSATLKTSVSSLDTFRKSIQSFSNAQLLGSLSPMTAMQKDAEAKRQYEAMLEKANAGDETARAGISAAATAFLAADQVVNASSSAYVANFAKVQSDLAALDALAGKQMTDAQAQLSALDQQTSLLSSLNATAGNIEAALTTPGQPVTMPAPVMNWSEVGTSNMAPLVEEIKGLRADNADLKADNADLKAGNAALLSAVKEQTSVLAQATLTAAANNAKEVTSGAAGALSAAAWKAQMMSEAG